jgi:hypothetical protein
LSTDLVYPLASPHAFSLEKIVARRIAIEGEDYDEQKAKDDWEQEWDD